MLLPQRATAVLMSFLLALVTIPVEANAQTSSQNPSQSGAQTTAAPEEYAPLTPDELDGLVAPIALIPMRLSRKFLARPLSRMRSSTQLSG